MTEIGFGGWQVERSLKYFPRYGELSCSVCAILGYAEGTRGLVSTGGDKGERGGRSHCQSRIPRAPGKHGITSWYPVGLASTVNA